MVDSHLRRRTDAGTTEIRMKETIFLFGKHDGNSLEDPAGCYAAAGFERGRGGSNSFFPEASDGKIAS